MLETLTKGFRNARLKLQGKTTLTEDNVATALRDVRMSLLEADVELSVVKGFLDKVKERAIGEVVHLKAPADASKKLPAGMKVSPADHFIKICHDELNDLMGPVDTSLNLSGSPALIMMVGLQGSGKTTTAGKLAKRLLDQGHKPLMVAADIYRPAAVDQLMTLGRKLGVPVFSIKGMKPVELCKLGVQQARNVGRDVVIFDTAGRLAIDNELMDELVQIKATTKPGNILFVCDAMIGQDAVRTAAEFDRLLDFTGFVLTKLDGDARGGAALAIKQVTGKPIKFLGMGEQLDKLEEFRPEGLADRILGFGDVVGLMKDFEKVVDQDAAENDARRMLEGQFDYDQFLRQIHQIRKMGNLRSIFEKLPGMGELLEQIPPEALDDRELLKVEAIVQSMTRQERREPDIINRSRMIRISKGCGRSLEEVEALQERFNQTRVMMSQLGQSGMFGGLGGGLPGMGRAQRRSGATGPGGMPFPPGLMGGKASPEDNLSPAERLRRAKESKDKRKARKAARKQGRS